MELADQQERRDAAIYIAAMIQGEGSVVMRWNTGGGRKRNGKSLAVWVAIYTSEKPVAEEIYRRCQALDAGAHCYTYRREGNGFGKRPLATIRVMGIKRLARFLPHVIPFLVGEKKEQAEIVLMIAQSRLSMPINTPYTEAERIIIDECYPNRSRRSESSTTNTLRASQKLVMIESGPMWKHIGGERATEYPAPLGAVL